MAPQGAARFAVRFDELPFREDLAHATGAGREIALIARQRFERDGATPTELHRCAPEHRDGTRLPNCVKSYLATPDDAWRMVFEFHRDTATGEIYLAFLAFGLGHPSQPWRPSVYQVAHQRLHGAA
jgi:hypothetical protein